MLGSCTTEIIPDIICLISVLCMAGMHEFMYPWTCNENPRKFASINLNEYIAYFEHT